MHFTSAFVSLVLLSSPLSLAGHVNLASPFHLRHQYLEKASLENAVRRDAHWAMNHELYHQRRNADPQAPSPSATTSPAPITGNNANFDRDVWNSSVTTACMTPLTAMSGNVSNPAGMVACYNIPFLDTKAGVFEGDLRLYQVAQPSGFFVGIPVSDFNVALSYLNAQISSNQLVKRSEMPGMGLIAVERRDTSNDTLTTGLMTMMAAFQFVGLINSNVMTSTRVHLNDTQFMSILTPQITISGLSHAANPPVQVNTTIDADTVSFVAGKFGTAKGTNTTANAVAASAIASIAAVYVVPGITFGLYPTGFIVTCLWTGAFCLAVGWGTVGRYRFREQYRSRLRRAGLAPLKKGGAW